MSVRNNSYIVPYFRKIENTEFTHVILLFSGLSLVISYIKDHADVIEMVELMRRDGDKSSFEFVLDRALYLSEIDFGNGYQNGHDGSITAYLVALRMCDAPMDIATLQRFSGNRHLFYARRYAEQWQEEIREASGEPTPKDKEPDWDTIKAMREKIRNISELDDYPATADLMVAFEAAVYAINWLITNAQEQ